MFSSFIRRATPRRQRGGLTEPEIVNGYRWILGRHPDPAEIRASRAYFGTYGNDAHHAFQNGLIISEEFRLRRIHVQQIMRVDPIDLFRTKIVFLHIEKCAGTSMRAMLAAQVPACRVCPENFNGLPDWTANELAAYDLFAGHFDLSACQVVPGPSAIITMLREPKARLLSLYNFWRAHRPHPSFGELTLVGLAQRHTVMDFFSHGSVALHPNIRDAIVGQLTRRSASPILADGFPKLEREDAILANPAGALDAAWNAVTGLTSFGLIDQFERSRLLLNHQLGLHMQPIDPRQALLTLVSPMLEENRPAPDRMTAPLDALLDSLTPLDQVLYRRASALFEERAGALNT